MEFLPTEPRPLGSEFLSGRSRNSAGRTGEGRPGEESRKNRAICGMGRGGIAQRAKKRQALRPASSYTLQREAYHDIGIADAKRKA